MPAHELRLKYESEVQALREAAWQMLDAGTPEEDVARWVVGERNALKLKYRELTPAPVLARIDARTLARYGNTLGPSVDALRAGGKTWRQIIDSAARAGEHGGVLFSEDRPWAAGEPRRTPC